jgi:non-ribosomal peptide synthetase component E (peptide arylation enzyme)
MRSEIWRPTAETIERYTRSGLWGKDTCDGILERRAKDRPDQIALTDFRRSVTFRQLLDEVERMAGRFAAAGVGVNDVITIQLPNWIEFVVAFLGAQRIGAIASQIGVDFRAREVEPIMRLCETRLYVCPRHHKGFDYPRMVGELQSTLPRLEALCVVDADGTVVIQGPDREGSKAQARKSPLNADANAVTRMGFTSGTTGNPKVVLHSHNTILAACRACVSDMEITDRDVSLVYLPLGLTWGYLTMMQAILAGGRTVLLDGFDPHTALSAIERERVTFVPTAPASIVSMLNAPDRDRFDTSSLRILATGGASCPIEIIRAARAHLGGHLCEFYGLIETGYGAYTRPTDDPEVTCGSVGKATRGMSIRLIDEVGGEILSGETGEIAVEGPSVTLGYYRNEEANRAAFTADGLFRTGDIGRFDHANNLWIVGRIKEIINRGGKKFFPREVEEILYTHPKILHAAIVGVPDPRLGERNCLCVVERPGAPISLNEVIDHLRGQVANYKLPETLEIFEDLPMTPSGKVQRPTLLRMVLDRVAGRPRDDVALGPSPP